MPSMGRETMTGRKAVFSSRTRGHSVGTSSVGSTVMGSREGSEARQRLGSSSSGEILPQYQLERLAEHKYSVQGSSMLEPLMQPFWRVAVEYLPLWLAPNAITLIGLIVNAASTLILVLYCPTATGEAPAWVYFLCALGLFTYQTMDAIDGKQARRTNSSSPLGELFDHGCDALSIVFVAVGTCIAVQLGTHPWLMFMECFSIMFVYYSAHWQTYCSAVLRFGFIDVTEGQLSVIVVFIMTGLLGADFWNMEILSTGYEVKMLPAAASIIGSFWSLKNYLIVIFVNGGVGKNGSTVAGTSVLAPALPIIGLLAVGGWVALYSPSLLYLRHPILFVITFGLTASKLTNKLVLAHMSRGEMTLMDSAFISPALLALNIYVSILINEFYLLCFCALYALVDLMVYSSQVCRLICNHLNIHCFHIAPPPAESKPIRAQQHHLIDRGGWSSASKSSRHNSSHDRSKH